MKRGETILLQEQENSQLEDVSAEESDTDKNVEPVSDETVCFAS